MLEINHSYRVYPKVTELKEVIMSGKLGESEFNKVWKLSLGEVSNTFCWCLHVIFDFQSSLNKHIENRVVW